jgi:hypothetical protein
MISLRSLPSLLIAFLLGLAAPCASAGDPLPARLASHDTAIEVSAGEHAPRLTALALAGGETWHNRAEEAPPELLDDEGGRQGLRWRLDRAASHGDPRRLELVYLSESPKLRLRWVWRVRAAHGPIEHTVLVENLSGQTLWLPLIPSMRFDWVIDPEAPLERFWVEKGADTPSAKGTHLDALGDGDVWEGTSSTYARPVKNRAREMIPYVLIEDTTAGRRGWYLGIEFSGRTRITLTRSGAALRGEAGLDPAPGPYRTRLPPGGSFATPTVFIGTFSGGADSAGNILRRWVREVLGDVRTIRDPSYPLMVSNSWGSGTAVDEPLAQHMIEDAASLGLEMFHLDAGWFRAVGDWRADPVKFPHGIAAIADFAHAHGVRFGLWVSWAQAGVSGEPGALSVRDPVMRDWLIADPPAGWQAPEPFKGISIDLGVPAASGWAERELERIIGEYHLDMLEHDGYLVAQGSTRTDHPAAPPDAATLKVSEDSGYLWVEGSNSTDVSSYATRAYYRIHEQLRARHPKLLLELCNDGGRMMDFGSAAHGDYFSVTDTYDPLSNRRAFFDESHVLPPAMLESYVADWPAPRLANFRYLLRSGMLGWFSLMLDTRRWTLEQRADARLQFALYRLKLRPLIRTADLYHVSERPDGVHWDGLEYYAPALRRGVLYAFRGASADEPVHRFRLAGLSARTRYALTYQDGGPASRKVASGAALMQQGVEVTLAAPLSSELVFIDELGSGPTAVRPANPPPSER